MIFDSIVRVAKRRIRTWKLSRASETERISFFADVEHGSNVRLTGKVDFGSEPFLIRLGSDITIADGVRFLTHDGGVRVFRKRDPGIHVYAPITVGNSVFIGVNAIIMPGVNVGSNSVIGAGSVVTKDVPSGEVWAGVPARRLKTTEEYRATSRSKAIDWPVGSYDDQWREHLRRIFND